VAEVLYQTEWCPFSSAVREVLTELGTDFVARQVEPWPSERHGLQDLAGSDEIPVLETEDGYLFESAALCLQVADLHPEAGLIPPLGTHERGLVYQWTVWAMSELEPAIIRMYTALQGEDAERTANAQERLARTFAALEQALDGHDFVTGADFTVADVVVGGVLVTTRRWQLMPSSPNVNAYLDRLDARPAKQRAYASA